MMTPKFDVRILILDDDGEVDSDNAEVLAWPEGAPVPQCGDVFGVEGECYQVYDVQWHYHRSPEGSHLHYTMVLGEPTEDDEED